MFQQESDQSILVLLEFLSINFFPVRALLASFQTVRTLKNTLKSITTMKLPQTSTFGAILILIAIAYASPIVIREDPLSNVVTPGKCRKAYPDDPGYCFFESITRQSGFASVYIQDDQCKLIGYDSNVPVDTEVDIKSSLSLPVKVTMKDGGSRAFFTYDGIKFGPGNEKQTERICKKDQNGEVACSFPWLCGDNQRKAPGTDDMRLGCCFKDEK